MAIGIGAILGIVNKALGLVRKAWDRLELAGAYIAGYKRAQKVHEEAHEDEIEATHDDARDVEDMTDEELNALLGASDEPDGVLDDSSVPSDTESGDNPEHKV